MKNPKFPTAKDIVELIIKKYRYLDINELHKKCYIEILSLKNQLYEKEIDKFLEELELPIDVVRKIKNKIFKPVYENQVEYHNLLEKIVRPIVQAIQPISGNIAELCAVQELIKHGLKEGLNFKRKVGRTDLVLYYPNLQVSKVIHRVEVKNVSLRERATRGLKFDGDSLLGFFNNPKEFTEENVKIIEELCKKTSGYCYIPPDTLSQIKYKSKKFKSNTEFGKDMKYFCLYGKLP